MKGPLLVLGLCSLAFAADRGVWLDVPFVQQRKNGCGPAVVLMVVQYWQHQLPGKQLGPADLTTVQEALYSEKDHGTRASDLEHYLQTQNFQTFAFSGAWDDLQHHLLQGRPLIAALKPSSVDRSLHYVVVAGVDPGQGLVLVNDPAQKKLLKQDRASFEKQWASADHWTLLALPK